MGEPALGKVGKYELIERLAAGGMAEVFKARVIGEHGFQKVVAIKKILPHLARDQSFVKMFIDEARITAVLEHPNIVQVFEFAAEDGELYIALQFVDGIDMLTLLRRNEKLHHRLPTNLAVQVAQDILDALDYAHRVTDASGRHLGIIHRDVSPSNVLISRRGDVKLTDFGIAWAYEREHKTDTGKVKGKMSYLSPELVGGATPDARSDVFSAGILLAEMLMGHRLFTSANELDVLLMVRDADIRRLDKYAAHVPRSLQAIARKALARSRRQRFQSAGEFRDALADWMLEAKARKSPQALAQFLEDTEAMAERVADGDDSSPRNRLTLSGPTTQERMSAVARSAAAGRALYDRPPTERIPEEPSNPTLVPGEVGESESGRTVRATAYGDLDQPGDKGRFAHTDPIRVLHQLAESEATGLLLLEGRAGILKEAYMTGGHPEFVASNVTEERLGEYLISRRCLTEKQLARALAVMPHFGGHLADTLVGLGLLNSLEVFRLLSQQVADKLIDVCTWSKGRYRWYPGKANPWPARKLHLNTYEIIGAGAMAVPVERMIGWAKQHAAGRPYALVDDPPLSRFALGEQIDQVCVMIDGRRTIKELAAGIADLGERLDALRILHLLIECDLVGTR